jgi:ribose transport system ATP-binding protein
VPLLEVQDVVMQFPAVRALDGVSLAFEPGEVYGVIGENGAGKSTLMRILSGLQRPTSGQIFIEGNRVEFASVRDALGHGIAMIHQELNLVNTLSVAENVFLGREPRRLGFIDRRLMNEKAAAYLARVGARFSATTSLGRLSLAGKQLVEIAKALAQNASVLIMDEPTAVLSEQETTNLFSLISELREQGVTVIYISHRLAEVELICDRITVLRDGKLVRTVARGEASQAELASHMVGRELGDLFPEKATVGLQSEGVTPALSISGLGDGERVFDASLEVRSGEIVGLAGLVGSGRTELAELIIGIRKAKRGTIEREGKLVRRTSPADAARSGIVYVSEDRKETGLHLSMDVVENTTLANLRSYSRPLLRKKEEERATREWVKRLDIRAGNLRAPVLYLSGGNQQKVSIAKWLELKPKVLILDEPTRGVDVGAKRELYQLIQALAADGLACLVISSELMELIGLCHRIAVMREGRIVGEVTGSDMNEEAIMLLAAGVGAA